MNNYSIGTPVNMSPSGIATFAKTNICSSIDNINADIAIIGAPFDLAIQGKSGTRLGPRGIRIASTRFSYKSGGSYDPERNMSFIDADLWKIVDCGDVDYVPGDIDTTFSNLESAVSLIAKQNVMPVILGGDHSITYPIIKGLPESGKFNIIHIDAHLDWTKSVGGQTRSNGSPMRNIAGISYVEKIIHIGIRGIGSSGVSDFEDARNNGDLIYSVKNTRAIGIEKILQDIDKGSKVYLTLDIDAMDAVSASGTGSPMFGGFWYDEMVDILEAVAYRHEIIGFDVNEVSPPYDDMANTTCYLAARLISDFIGFITKSKELALKK